MKLGIWIILIIVALIFFGKFIIPMILGLSVSILIIVGIAALIVFAMKTLWGYYEFYI